MIDPHAKMRRRAGFTAIFLGLLFGGSGGCAGDGNETDAPGDGDGSSSGGSPASGGESGTGGDSSACGDTNSDPENCGTCGKVCQRFLDFRCGDPFPVCCQEGECLAVTMGCLTQSTGPLNCGDYCAQLGESCAEDACGSNGTANEYTPVSEDDVRPERDLATTLADCENETGLSQPLHVSCATTLDFNGGASMFRCCCTDSQL